MMDDVNDELPDRAGTDETGVYHYGLDVDDDGTETLAEAAQLTDGTWYLRFISVHP